MCLYKYPSHDTEYRGDGMTASSSHPSDTYTNYYSGTQIYEYEYHYEWVYDETMFYSEIPIILYPYIPTPIIQPAQVNHQWSPQFRGHSFKIGGSKK